MKSNKILLILDLDGTITRSDNLIRFTRFMILKRRNYRFLLFFPLYILLKAKMISNVQFKIAYAKYILKGMSKKAIEIDVEAYISSSEFNDDMCSTVLNSYVNISNTEKVILSANYDFLVEKITRKLHLTSSKSIELEVDNGIFTGAVLGEIPYDEGKVRCVKSIEQNYFGYYKIGIGDSKSDLPLLKYLDEGYLVKRMNNVTRLEKI